MKHVSLLLINNFRKIVFQRLLIHITAYVLGIHNNKYAETNHAVNCTILEYSLFIMPQLLIIKLWILQIPKYTVLLKTSLIIGARNKEYLTKKTAVVQKIKLILRPLHLEMAPFTQKEVKNPCGRTYSCPSPIACWVLLISNNWPWVDRFYVTHVNYWQADKSQQWHCLLPCNYKQG